jgi:HTH-type transcriptional regulator / antitoxin HigA
MTATIKPTQRRSLPSQFEALVRLMPPQAILDDIHYRNTLEMIDRLTRLERLSDGQSLYLETLVQLVQAFEEERHAIETSDLSGLDSLKHLMDETHMSGSDMARLLGVHPSMGSKILKGERCLTLEHVRRLAEHFKVSPALFMD